MSLQRNERETDLCQVDTKTVQLCRQVEEAISYALLSSANPLLRELYVVSVEPLRGAALLRVVVSGYGPIEHERTARAIERAAGYLRSEVARAINRKRVPSLKIELVPEEEMDDAG